MIFLFILEKQCVKIGVDYLVFYICGLYKINIIIASVYEIIKFPLMFHQYYEYTEIVLLSTYFIILIRFNVYGT